MSGTRGTAGLSGPPIQQALALVHQGRLQQAAAVCRQILVLQPRDFNALQLLGLIALQQGDYAGAAQGLGDAIAVNAGNAAAYSNLAVAQLGLRRPLDALASCGRALAIDARVPEAHSNRGKALSDLERHEEALASYDQSLALAPNNPETWSSRAMALLKLQRREEALAAFDRALALSPQSANILNSRGTVLRDLRRPAEARASYERALSISPDFPEALCNLANLAQDAGRYEEAIGYCDRALAIRPDLADAFNIRGAALRFLNRLSASAAAYARVLTLAPRFEFARGNLFFLRASLCDWSDRAEESARIVAAVHAGDRVCSPHSFLSVIDDPSAQLQCARSYVANFPELAPLWRGERFQHPRRKIAYLSADFGDHPVSHLIAGVLERHDRTQFETIGVALSREAGTGTMRKRMEGAFEHYIDATLMSDRETAARLRAMEVDIAVDLNGHTRGGRLGIFGFRPAPLQVGYLGYAGTSGIACIDYLLADDVTIPREHEEFFSERIVRLPHCFLPNDDRQPIAEATPTRGELGLPDSGFVFCAFNNTYKLNPTMFDIWMRLLRETPGSVLWLRSGEQMMIDNLRREAGLRGVAAERLVFAGKVPAMAAHLARYRQADLFLDTTPYGAHATSRDALWAGLPVLTCLGTAFASRVAASLLSALDLPELVAPSLNEYATRALAIAHSPGLLAEIAGKLAMQRQLRPVFETDLFRRHLESAYQLLWQRHEDGGAPANIDVPKIR
jgi:predicted O-linked N-acetylglucosamine transferase (SPINDLY family)